MDQCHELPRQDNFGKYAINSVPFFSVPFLVNLTIFSVLIIRSDISHVTLFSSDSSTFSSSLPFPSLLFSSLLFSSLLFSSLHTLSLIPVHLLLHSEYFIFRLFLFWSSRCKVSSSQFCLNSSYHL